MRERQETSQDTAKMSTTAFSSEAMTLKEWYGQHKLGFDYHPIHFIFGAVLRRRHSLDARENIKSELRSEVVEHGTPLNPFNSRVVANGVEMKRRKHFILNSRSGACPTLPRRRFTFHWQQ